MNVWIEWICSRCEELHRIKFKIVMGLSVAKKVHGLLKKEGYYIEDSMVMPKGTGSRSRHGSRIFVKWDTDISKIFSMLEAHMLEYYSVKKDSLNMDACRE